MPCLVVQKTALAAAAEAAPLGRALLAEARECSSAILCSYTVPGDVLSLGRHHVVPAGPAADGVSLARRLTGGRPAPAGEGFVSIALALPHVAALAGVDPAALAPEQVLNRYVRGLLGALESLGVAAYYPGRDRVTVEGRTIASLAFEVAPDGAALVEASLAVARSFATVSSFADRADPAGVVPVELVLPEQATSIGEAAGRTPGLDEIAAALAAGYAARLGVDVAVAPHASPRPAADPSWIDAGRLAPHLDRHALAREMLGVVEVYAARRDDRVGDVRVCGDFIAPSGTVADLEAALRGAPIERDALRARAAAALAAPRAFMLGVRSPAVVADLVWEACAS
jgi:lipoate-protein ligase A